MINTFKEVDLNLRHYIGESTDVIKDVKNNIRDYLRNPEVSDTNRSIYSAIYHALTYYENIANLSLTGITGSKTFLENTIEQFEKDFKYLSNKYNSKNISVPTVIFAKARIKSPISALDKILEKVAEYVHEGRDLSKLNESLRDFMGLRIIVEPPLEIKAKGKQAESDFCYKVFNDLLEYRGIYRQINNETTLPTDYTFIPVNTSHDPNKLQKLKERPIKEGFLYNPDDIQIYIPKTRPDSLEKIDEFLKDYRMYPKVNLYQRLHVCASPFFSEFIPEQKISSFIMPTSSKNTAIEYQFCSMDEEKFAEYGKSAHTLYKSNKNYHRLAVPLFIKPDFGTQTMRLCRFDESMKDFYGYTFKSMFNIDYQTFLQTFNTRQQDEILARNLVVEFDKDKQDYRLIPSKNTFIFTDEQNPNFVENLLKTATPEELKRFYDINNISDGTIHPKSNKQISNSKKSFNFYTLHSLSTREKNKISGTEYPNLKVKTSVKKNTTPDELDFE